MDPNVTNLQNIANQSQQSANQLATQAPTLADSFKNAVMTKYGQDNPLIQAQSGALKNYIAGMGGEMEKYLPQNTGGIALSPTHIEALMAQDRANLLAPLSATNELVSMGYGGLQNLMNSANASYQSQVDAAQKAAELARQQYADAYTQWAKQKELELTRRGQDLQYGGLQDQMNFAKAQADAQNAKANAPLNADQLWQQVLTNAGSDPNSVWNYINNVLKPSKTIDQGVLADMWRRQTLLPGAQPKTGGFNLGSLLQGIGSFIPQHIPSLKELFTGKP